MIRDACPRHGTPILWSFTNQPFCRQCRAELQIEPRHVAQGRRRGGCGGAREAAHAIGRIEEGAVLAEAIVSMFALLMVLAICAAVADHMPAWFADGVLHVLGMDR